mgnify:CR=1 FL=1
MSIRLGLLISKIIEFMELLELRIRMAHIIKFEKKKKQAKPCSCSKCKSKKFEMHFIVGDGHNAATRTAASANDAVRVTVMAKGF